MPRVVNFIENLHNGNLYISDEARKLMYGHSSANAFNSINSMYLIPPRSLSESLGNAINGFDLNPTLDNANRCLVWINRAYANGVVKESKGAISKLKEKEELIRNLEAELESTKANHKELEKKHSDLSNRFVLLQGSYDELDRRMNKMLPKDDFFHE